MRWNRLPNAGPPAPYSGIFGVSSGRRTTRRLTAVAELLTKIVRRPSEKCEGAIVLEHFALILNRSAGLYFCQDSKRAISARDRAFSRFAYMGQSAVCGWNCDQANQKASWLPRSEPSASTALTPPASSSRRTFSYPTSSPFFSATTALLR